MTAVYKVTFWNNKESIDGSDEYYSRLEDAVHVARNYSRDYSERGYAAKVTTCIVQGPSYLETDDGEEDENIGWGELNADNYTQLIGGENQDVLSAVFDSLLERYPNQMFVATEPSFLHNGKVMIVSSSSVPTVFEFVVDLVSMLEAGATAFLYSVWIDVDGKTHYRWATL